MKDRDSRVATRDVRMYKFTVRDNITGFEGYRGVTIGIKK